MAPPRSTGPSRSKSTAKRGGQSGRSPAKAAAKPEKATSSAPRRRANASTVDLQSEEALFDRALWLRVPTLPLSATITLAEALADASRKGLPAWVNDARARMTRAAASAQSAWAARKSERSVVPEVDTVAVDREADAAWSALKMRLDGYGLLPDEGHPRAARAREIARALFGEGGLSFTQTSFAAQRAAMAAMLEVIDTQGLSADIDALAGAEFLARVRAVQPRYDAMVRAALQRDESPGQNLAEQLRALQRSIADFASKVVATVDLTAPGSAARATKALLPLAKLRDAARPKAQPEEETEKPEAAKEETAKDGATDAKKETA
ncbi:MAG: hypothetical protein R3A52_01430 [Polyangiales bacterium]